MGNGDGRDGDLVHLVHVDKYLIVGFLEIIPLFSLFFSLFGE